MVNKRFSLGILVIALVFLMMAVGCYEDESYEPEERPKFDYIFTVREISGDRNGQSFTVSLIANNKTVASDSGIIAGNEAKASFVLKELPDGNYYKNNGRTEYRCYLGLKIGNEPIKITTKEIESLFFSSDGTYFGGGASVNYRFYFKDN